MTKNKTNKTTKKLPLSLETTQDDFIIRINVPITLKIKNTEDNFRLLYILLRLLCDKLGKPLCTFAQIAQLLGKKERQNANNFWREFEARGGDFLAFLSRKAYLAECVPLIEDLVCDNIILPISELYRKFINKHDYKMSLTAFHNYLEQINPKRVLEVAKRHITKALHEGGASEIIDLIAKQSNSAVICDNLLELKKKSAKKESHISEMKSSLERQNLCYLVHFFLACGLNYEIIALILNVSKGTVYNLAHEIRDLKSIILNSIEKWSGKISIDEKYIKFRRSFVYVIAIVDFVTGLPLYCEVYDSIKTEGYADCLRGFKAIFKTDPKLIVSDDSSAIAAGIKRVFPKVKHQLCKFHKLKTLNERITKCVPDDDLREELKTLAQKAFARKTVSGRKKAFRKLIGLLPDSAARFVEFSILGQWDRLTGSLTSNVSERFNRKIEKVLSGRYGFKSIDTVKHLVLSLWLKELIIKGSYALHEDSLIANLNISQICQENIDYKHLDHLFSTNLKKSA